MILDTNAISDFIGGDPGVVAAVQHAHSIEIPVIVAGEYFFGVAASRHRREYEAAMEELLAGCQVLSVELATAAAYAEIRRELKKAGTPIPVNDLWVAALSRQHGLAVLSRDSHFDYVRGLKRISW